MADLLLIEQFRALFRKKRKLRAWFGGPNRARGFTTYEALRITRGALSEMKMCELNNIGAGRRLLIPTAGVRIPAREYFDF